MKALDIAIITQIYNALLNMPRDKQDFVLGYAKCLVDVYGGK